MKRQWYSWPAAFVLVVLVVFAEFLPIFGGRGADARFDWSFAYVTLHFVLLPLLSGLHVAWNLAGLVLGRQEGLKARLQNASAIIVSLSYLVLLFLRPVFPLGAAGLWESLSVSPLWAG